MPITRCPGCGESLEVPAVVPGGLVACPHCDTEFAVGGGGGGGGRGGARGGGGAGRRGGRGGYDRDDAYDDEGYGRRGYRKRTDPLPIIILVGSVLILGGAAIFFLMKGRANREAADAAFIESIQQKQEAFRTLSRLPDNPNGDALDLRCDFLANDLLTIQELNYTSGLDVKDSDGGRQPIYGLSFRMVTEEHGEKIVSVAGGGETTHEGRYHLQSFQQGDRSLIPGPLWLDARFRTDRLGNPVPGSFSQTGGTTVTPAPAFIADRGFGILPSRPVKMMETWGTDSLPNPFLPHVNLDGTSLTALPLLGAREGGWRVATGTITYEPGGQAVTRGSVLELQLNALENRAQTNGRFRGEPARITASTLWQGKAFYDLHKNYLQRVEELKVNLWIVVKTPRTWWEWRGTASTNYKMYKDP